MLTLQLWDIGGVFIISKSLAHLQICLLLLFDTRVFFPVANGIWVLCRFGCGKCLYLKVEIGAGHILAPMNGLFEWVLWQERRKWNWFLELHSCWSISAETEVTEWPFYLLTLLFKGHIQPISSLASCKKKQVYNPSKHRPTERGSEI